MRGKVRCAYCDYTAPALRLKDPQGRSVCWYCYRREAWNIITPLRDKPEVQR